MRPGAGEGGGLSSFSKWSPQATSWLFCFCARDLAWTEREREKERKGWEQNGLCFSTAYGTLWFAQCLLSLCCLASCFSPWWCLERKVTVCPSCSVGFGHIFGVSSSLSGQSWGQFGVCSCKSGIIVCPTLSIPEPWLSLCQRGVTLVIILVSKGRLLSGDYPCVKGASPWWRLSLCQRGDSSVEIILVSKGCHLGGHYVPCV